MGVMPAGVATVSTAPGPPPRPLDDAWDVDRVVDGDTIDITHDSVVLTVRLIGINAPEHDECWGSEATDALVDLLGEGPVWLDAGVTDQDQYGRLLRYVVDADGDDAGAAMLEQGAAYARSYPPDTARDELYASLQSRARAAEVGLWAPDACSAPAHAAAPSVAISVEINPNPPGDDNEHLVDEWVRFTNDGANPVDLTGWGVKDESSSHRYTFGPFVLGPGASVTLRTGCGTDTATDLYWCEPSGAVWNNGRDTVFLTDPAGNIVVSAPYVDGVVVADN